MTSNNGLLEFLTKQGSALPEEIVHVEAWGRDITLRGLTSRERDAFEEESLRLANAKTANGKGKRQTATADLTNFRARLVSKHIVENGMRTMANARGEEILGEQPAVILDKLFAVSQRLSGLSAEDIEELTGNSGATGADELNSALPASSDAPSQNSNGGSANVS